MHTLTRMVTAIVLLMAVACGRNYNEQAPSDVASTNKPAPQFKSEDGIASADSTAQVAGNNKDQDPSKAKTDAATNIDWDKKIIKNATVSVETPDFKLYNEALHNTIKRFGGYIAQEEQNQSDYKIENNITIKVPVAQFDDLVASLTRDKDKLIVKKITSEDVTGEVVDTRSRIETKKQVRLRYLDLLKQAKDMKEILEVQKEIDDMQEEMDAASGRVSYLTHASAYSTVQLSYFQVLNASAEKTNEPDFGQKVLQALKNGLSWVGELSLVLLNLWPLWLGLGFLFWGVRKWRVAKPVKQPNS